MSANHSGNLLNQITFEEHVPDANAKRVVIASGATIFAVVNTGSAGNVTLDQGSRTGIVGNITLDPGSLTGIAGNLTLSDSKGFIGLTTLGGGFANIRGNVTLDPGSFTGVKGNLTIDSGNISLKGNVTLDVGSLVGVRGNVTLDVGSLVGVRGNVTLSDSKTFIGLVTVGGIGQITLSDPKGFIGLVTAIALNGGTNKTFIPMTVAFAQASIVTIAVPTGGGALFKITNLVLNSNATTRLNIKSGATYLTGNVSLGMTIYPGGGWVESGSPDSPTYIGLASGAAIVLEKFDTGGIISQIGGKLIYFQE